jgi:hypothetical protein
MYAGLDTIARGNEKSIGGQVMKQKNKFDFPRPGGNTNSTTSQKSSSSSSSNEEAAERRFVNAEQSILMNDYSLIIGCSLIGKHSNLNMQTHHFSHTSEPAVHVWACCGLTKVHGC